MNNSTIKNNQATERPMKCVEFLVNALVSCGVTHVFGGHGGAVVALVDAIMKNPHITWVCCRCEVNASQMAAAYAKLHGRLACCVATSGPGAGHLLSGLLDADQDRVPLLVLTGLKDLGHIRYADFQDIDQASIYRAAGLPFSESVINVNQLMPLTRNALTLAVAFNRCVHLAIPVDIQQQVINNAPTKFCLGTSFQQQTNRRASEDEINAIVTALMEEMNAGRNVVICCGWRAPAYGEEIQRIAELMNAPILTSFDGKGSVDEMHSLAFGVVGVYGNPGTRSSENLLKECDTVISVCVVDHTEILTNKDGLQVRRLIQIDERLSVGDAMRFSPDVTVACGHLKESLNDVAERLERKVIKWKRLDTDDSKSINSLLEDDEKETIRNDEVSKGTSFLHSNWFSTSELLSDVQKCSLNEEKIIDKPSTYLSFIDAKDLCSTEFCHPAVFFNVLSDTLNKDAVICADIGDNALWMASSLVAKRGQRTLTSEHMGIMGCSLNAALAASTTTTDHQTLVVAGDGGFQMSLNELATHRDHQSSNVLVVVVENSRLGRVQNESWGPGLNADGCWIGSPDYVKLFEAYGYPNGKVLETSNRGDIRRVIEEGWASAAEYGLCVIVVKQDPRVHPIMHKIKKKHSLKQKDVTSDISKSTTDEDGLYPSSGKNAVTNLDTSEWGNNQQEIKKWLNGLEKVEFSSSVWIGNNISSLSIAETVQNIFSSYFEEGKAPQLFPTKSAQQKFDQEWKKVLLDSLPKEEFGDLFDKGISNTHNLKLQLMACPKDFDFPLHAHANFEMLTILESQLGERRCFNHFLPKEILKKKEVKDEIPSDDDMKKVAADLEQSTVFEDKGRMGIFSDRTLVKGQAFANQTGSVHQSYTHPENGCLLFCLWAGYHATFLPHNFKQKMGVDMLKGIDEEDQ